MKTGVLKMLWLICGVLLIFAGVLSFLYPVSTLMTIVSILGLVMLISGVANIAVYFMARNYLNSGSWALADGIITVLLSVLILTQQTGTVTAVAYVAGMWMLFSGVTRLITSFDLKKLGMREWGWPAILGVLGMVLGFVSFLKPIVAANIIGVTVGLVFLLQGGGAVLMSWLIPKVPPTE